MKPEPSALTSFWSRIGSPAMKGERAIEPVTWAVASGRSLRLMKLELAVVLGPATAQEGSIALECHNSGVQKTVALSTDTVLGATDAAVREELESGALVRLAVKGWLSPPSTTGIVRLHGRTASPAAQAAIAAIERAAQDINV